MPEIPSLGGFRDVGGQTNVRFTRQDGDLQRTGQRPGNIFQRTWDWMTRSKEQVDQNKTTARSFVQEIREAYGDEIAQVASRELKSHLDLGRPLTGRRIEQVIG